MPGSIGFLVISIYVKVLIQLPQVNVKNIFILALEGQIVTCAHVAEAALGVHPCKEGNKKVGVYFPQARGGEEKKRCAKVTACFPHHDDDMVLLQLTDGATPLSPDTKSLLTIWR